MTSSLVDVCRFSPTAGGTTDWTFANAVQGFQSPAAASIVNGATYSYRAESNDLTQWEVGTGAYNTATGVLARTRVLFNSLGTTAKINFTVAPQVSIVALAEDLVTPALNRGYPTLSTAGGSTTFSATAGVAIDSTYVDFLALTSSISKTTGAWAVGSGNGSLDTGSIAASTWYHAFLIKRVDTAVVDVLTSLSATAPTLPSGYTLSRRIGSMKTDGSSNWLGFTQVGKDFYLSAPIFETGSVITVGTSRLTQALAGVPTGVVVKTLASVFAANTSTATNIWIGSLFIPDAAPNIGASPGSTIFTGVSTTSAVTGGNVSVYTNTLAQVAMRADQASSQVRWFSNGWTDNSLGN